MIKERETPFTVVDGDALTALADGSITLLGYSVSLDGTMNDDRGKALRRRFPVVYLTYYTAVRAGQLALGDILPVEVAAGRWVMLCVGQHRTAWWRHQTHYRALEHALQRLRLFARTYDLRVGLPFGLGCEQGRGDWAIVATIIERTVPAATVYRAVEHTTRRP